MDIQSNLFGTVNLHDGKICSFRGKLSEKDKKISLILNFKADCGLYAGTLMLNPMTKSSYGIFTTDDGIIYRDITLYKF